MLKEKPKIVITGGSGFIGTCAVDYCIKNNYSFINLDIKRPNKREHDVYWHEIDIRNRDAFENSLSSFQPTHILHLAAKLGMDNENIDDFSANTDGVRYLIDIGKQLSDLKRVVFTSSLIVCGNGYIPQNDTDYCPPNAYGKSKMIGELAVRNAGDLPYSWVIIRPTSVWGPWFEFSYKAFFRTIARGIYFHQGNNDVIKPFTYVENAVYMFFRFLLDQAEEIHGKTFYLSDYPIYTVREWANTIHRALNKNGSIRTIPFSILKIIALAGDALKIIGWDDPPLTSFRLNNMRIGGLYPIKKTEDYIGPLPYSLEHGVNETISWMKHNGEIK